MFDLFLYAITVLSVLLLVGRSKAETLPEGVTVETELEVTQSEEISEAIDPEIEPVSQPQEELPRIELDSLTVSQLRVLAKERGLKTRHNRNKKFNKQELIAVLAG